MNIAKNLENSAADWSYRPALLFNGDVYTFEKLDKGASAMANGLRERGIKKGDRVALYLPNCPEFVESYYGIQKLGAVPVSIGFMLPTEDVAHIVNDSQSKVVITKDVLVGNVPKSEDISSVDDIISDSDVRGSSFESIYSKPKDYIEALDMHPNDIAAILYTAATTGKSKGVMLSHNNLETNIDETVLATSLDPESIHLVSVPLYHCFGQNFLMNASILRGSVMVLEEKFNPMETIKTIVDNHVEFVYGVPTMFEAWLNLSDSKKMQPIVKYYFSAAAILNPETERKWMDERGSAINQGYGLTETSPFAAYNHWEPDKHKFNSIGLPIANVEMKIANINNLNKEMSNGELGEILIKGPNVMLGYFNNEQATKEAILPGGWFRSGDIGHRDADGYFFIDDRVKDVIISKGGFNVYPKHVEERIIQMSGVKQVAVIGGGPREDEYVKAFIVTEEGKELEIEDIIDFCKEHLPRYAIPREIKVVDTIPKSPVGKVLKKLLRD